MLATRVAHTTGCKSITNLGTPGCRRFLNGSVCLGPPEGDFARGGLDVRGIEAGFFGDLLKFFQRQTGVAVLSLRRLLSLGRTAENVLNLVIRILPRFIHRRTIRLFPQADCCPRPTRCTAGMLRTTDIAMYKLA